MSPRQARIPGWLAALALGTGIGLADQRPAPTPTPDPFAFLRPTVIVSDGERQRLDQGQTIARTVAARGSEVTVIAAIAVTVTADTLVAWMRRVDALKRSRHVLAIGRFSNPPHLADLATLALEDRDLESLRSCRPGDCALKLGAAEIAAFQQLAGLGGDAWKPAFQSAFQRVVLQRVQAFLAGGHAALEPLVDHGTPVATAARFRRLVDGTAFLVQHFPGVAGALGMPAAASADDDERLAYWAMEALGGKPVVSATAVAIRRQGDGASPEVLVTGTNVFATHYLTASVGITALVRGPEGRGYLVYVNRSELDVIRGPFGGVVRSVMERRLAAEAGDALRGLKARLESGGPPP